MIESENIETTPRIEDAIRAKLSGEAQKNALAFVADLQEKGFTFPGWGSGDDAGWNPAYNGNSFGTALVNDQFMFFIGLEWDFDRGGIVDGELKEFAWSHVTICPQGPCKPPYCENNKNRWKIFGKEFESACHSPLQFIGPDEKTLDNIKKLLITTK